MCEHYDVTCFWLFIKFFIRFILRYGDDTVQRRCR